jgi:hypothetical protein
MQEGAKTNSVLVMDCKSALWRFDDPRISELNGEMYIWQEFDQEPETYDAFEYEDLISGFMLLSRRENEGKDINKHILEWAKKWGVFESHKIMPNIYGQKVSSFLEDMHVFTAIWMIYRGVVNREYNLLQKALRDVEAAGGLFDFANEKESNYQWNAMSVILDQVELYIGRSELKADQMKKKTKDDEDHFEIKPVNLFTNLIDVLYMQLFLALTGKMRICPVCNEPFKPKRKDQRYDKEACKNTGKSRKFRKSFEEEHGIKYWERNKIQTNHTVITNGKFNA